MGQYDGIYAVEKKYCARAIKTSVFLALVLVLLSMAPIAKGLVMGTLFSIINFILMGASLPKRIGTSRKRAPVISGISILVRYAILAVPLAIAVQSAQFNLAATVGGLFMIQIQILLDYTAGLYIPEIRKKADS
ncbi:MAG: ATP synthase subunit I [Desulfosalsimonas sp.]